MGRAARPVTHPPPDEQGLTCAADSNGPPPTYTRCRSAEQAGTRSYGTLTQGAGWVHGDRPYRTVSHAGALHADVAGVRQSLYDRATA